MPGDNENYLLKRVSLALDHADVAGVRQIKTTKSKLPAAIFETLEDRRLLSTYVVTSTADSGAGSLRQAITDANNHVGPDTIRFAIGSGAKTITPKSSLPGLGDDTFLDASTQPGYAGKPLIELNGSSAGSSTDGIRVSGAGVIIKGLVINRFGGSGILVLGRGGDRVIGNYIGTNAAGTASLGNKAHGILLQSPDSVVGGLHAADRNVISGNGMAGVFIYTASAHNNVVLGNYIGTSAAGSAKIGNGVNGVQINGGASNWIGASATGSRNVIAGNTHDGILIINSGSTLNVVQGNYIGADATGKNRLGNGWYGIEISQPNNVVGGANAGAGNVVSANGYGGIVLFLSSAYGNRVQGNLVGTDASGTKDLGNTGRGVEFTNGAHDNRVGGTTADQRNVISGNDLGGVGFYSGSKNNLLTDNYIGTNAAGNAALANTGAGVMITDGAGTNYIGLALCGNVISGNTREGICITGGNAGAIIWGNFIGTDVTGRHKIANSSDGIMAASSGNQIGGRKKGTGNLIAGNGGNALNLYGSSNNYIARNMLGITVTGDALPNLKSNAIP